MIRIAIDNSRLGPVIASVAAAALMTAPAAPASAHDPHHPETGEELLASCADELDRGLPVDVNLPRGASALDIPSFNDAAQSQCWNFGWAEYYEPDTIPFTVAPAWAGPNINFTAWDCNHSSIHYGIYGQTSWGQWVYLRGGLMYGKLVGGVCRYSVSNFPAQPWGQDSWRQWAGGRFRIGLRSWNHDDPALGHTHDLCPDPVNCVWPTRLHLRND